MGPNFSPVIAFDDNQVIAMGPLGSADNGPPDTVEELRAWIYQPKSFTVPVPGADATALLWTANDAAADSVDQSQLRQNPGVCWMLPLTPITEAPFEAGRAFAVAIALISNGAPEAERDRGKKLGHVIWWGHPVNLINVSDAVKTVEGVFENLPDPNYLVPDYFIQLERKLQDLAEGRITESELPDLLSARK